MTTNTSFTLFLFTLLVAATTPGCTVVPIDHQGYIAGDTIHEITYSFGDASIPPEYHRSYTITVTADQLWHVRWVWIKYTSDANAGDRQIVIELQDATNDVIAQFRAGIVQAASLARYYLFAPSMADLDEFRDTDYLMTPLQPTVLLPAGYQVRVWDNNGVAAGDDMVIQMQYAYRAA